MSEKEFKKINVKPKTFDQIKWLSRILNKPVSTCITELFDVITQESFKYAKGANVSYSLVDEDIILTFSGRRNFSCGRASSEEELNKIIEQAVKPTENIRLMVCPDCNFNFTINLNTVNDEVFCPRCKADIYILGVA
jgi:hypothetical protein